MIEPRPSNLAFFARAGVLDRFFDDRTGGQGIRNKIDLGLHWGDTPELGEREIRILDSFFSDTVDKETVRSMFSRAFDGIRVRFLLAHPRGQFGSSRAKSISQDVEYEAKQGLILLARSAWEVRKSKNLPVQPASTMFGDTMSYSDVLRALSDIISESQAEVHFYDMTPSGPLYFFSDILVAGRFSAGTSAAELPWDMIVNSTTDNDLFDLLGAEFEYIWSSSYAPRDVLETEHNYKTVLPSVFLSYCSQDAGVAEDLRNLFLDAGVDPYLFEHRLNAGAKWTDDLKVALRNTNELVLIISENSKKSSDWLRAEAGACWIGGAHIIPATVSCECDVLPGLLDHYQSIDISTVSGKKKLVNGVLNRNSAKGEKNGSNTD